MARRYRKKAPRRSKKGSKKSMKRMPLVAGITPRTQRATISETIETVDLLPNTPYSAFFTLADFGRATALAVNFKQYRPKFVKYSYQPLFNLFQTGAGAVAKPNLYVIMNRTQENRVYTLPRLFQAGAQAMILNRKVDINYKPNWCSPGLIATTAGAITGVGIQGLKPQWSWTQCPVENQNTDSQQNLDNSSTTLPQMANNIANRVVYNGHNFFIEQEGAEPNVAICRLTVTVLWEFQGASDYGPAATSSQNNVNIVQLPTDAFTQLAPLS